MRYRFFDPGDEKLIESSELPVEGIAVALRSTGYDADADEVLELGVVDLEGNTLFSKKVKPQNTEEWAPSDATGGIAPVDVEDAEELYQYEGEISDLFENAEIAVAAHLPFAKSMIEQSWVTLPEYDGFDLVEEFRASHCDADYPGQPAAAASMEGIAAYYGVAADEPAATSCAQDARVIAACYKAFVREHAEQREAKGEDYWRRREERLAEENVEDARAKAVAAKREKNFNRINGLLWVAAGLIFVSLGIQVYQRGMDPGFMIVAGAVAVFAFIRAVVNFRR